MAVEFLTHEEICELTGARNKAGQIANLVRNGIRHTIKRNGWPAVTVFAVTGVPSSGEPDRPKWQPRRG